jgi:predicted metal-dependent hydrolase
MKKNERISEFVSSLAVEAAPGLHECYLGYFKCFNAGQYYEAHDVLEHLWLQGRDENYAFYKGLIQLAGAFVHLQKQYLRPEHPKDGRRLRPAMRLFQLALANLEPYAPRHLQLDVTAVSALCRAWIGALEAGEYAVNPWRPGSGPWLAPEQGLIAG